MDPLDGWPIPVKMVIARLAVLPGWGGYQRPLDLKARVLAGEPVRVVDELPGTDDGITFMARIVLDVFHRTYDGGRKHAEDCRQYLLAAPWTATVDGQVRVADIVYNPQSPAEVPWGDSDVRRWTASYAIDLRR